MLELVQIMGKVSGRDIVPNFRPVRDGDIYRSMLSNQKAKEDLDWEPKVALADGLQRTMEYFMRIDKGA